MRPVLPAYERPSSPLWPLFSQMRLRVAHQVSRVRSSRRFSFAILRRVLCILVAVLITVVVTVMVVKYQINERKAAADLPDYDTEENIPLSRKNLASKYDFPFEVGCREIDTLGARANAAFVMLARNSELEDVVSSMRSMERHFNQWFQYPWVFLNDEAFSAEFMAEVRKHTKAEVEFGTVPQEHWDFPADVDRDELHEFIQGQGDREVMYGNLESYHKMCRFYSGHFYDHPLVRKRTWYWRVEPDVQFFCDLTYDPFIEMEKHNKKYGFNVILEELYYTVPSLFLETKSFINYNNIRVKSAWDIMVKKYQTLRDKTDFSYFTWRLFDDLREQVERSLNLNRFLKKKNKTNKDLEQVMQFKNLRNVFEDSYKMPWLLLDKIEDEEYNLCHFWSNFEIARTDLFLSETYQMYFKHLEKVGGFYKERWGDAPVHSLAVAMMLLREELHYFRDIGYKHSTLGHCPNNAPGKQLPYVGNGYDEFEPQPWFKTFSSRAHDSPMKNGVGCRCECPRNFENLEDTAPMCIKRYSEVLSDDYRAFRPIDMNSLQAEVEKDIDQHLASGGTLGDGGKIKKSASKSNSVKRQ